MGKENDLILAFYFLFYLSNSLNKSITLQILIIRLNLE